LLYNDLQNIEILEIVLHSYYMRGDQQWSPLCRLYPGVDVVRDLLHYLPVEPDVAHVLFQLVSRRCERGSILLTSNRTVREWGEVFGGPVVAITIGGESYRLKEKRGAGLLTASKQRDASTTPSPQGVNS
jgi:IstB-like ATP binding protein